MRKEIYGGKNERLYNSEHFRNFVGNLDGAENVPTYSGFALDQHHFIFLVSPPGICLAYNSKANEAHITAIGNEAGISEIERKILQAANDFGK